MKPEVLFFDFGGCLDAPGIHTRILFWDSFARNGIVGCGDRSAFQEAYTVADQKMMSKGLAVNLGLKDFNRLNARLIAEGLGEDQERADLAADAVTQFMDACLRRNRLILEDFSGYMPMSVISNFTGNLLTILEEYELRSLFRNVTESYQTGWAKPDPNIFLAAMAKEGVPAQRAMYVGDNPKNDIEPARTLGMQTALIYAGFTAPENVMADLKIRDLADLKPLLGSA
jgi:FMN hydrolase / 5-amino-6-(5-phospho-D-ribitylamino)uracil phosphatase